MSLSLTFEYDEALERWKKAVRATPAYGLVYERDRSLKKLLREPRAK